MATRVLITGCAALLVLVWGACYAALVGSAANHLAVGHFVLGALLLIVWMSAALRGWFRSVPSQHLNRTRSRQLVNFTLSTGLVLAAALLIVLMGRFEHRWDLTSDSSQSLSPQSIRVLEQLEQPVQLVYLDIPGKPLSGSPSPQQLIDLFHYYNPARVQSRVVDVFAQPNIAESLQMLSGQRLYIKVGTGTGAAESRLTEVSEQSITTALLRLSDPDGRRIYVLQGHDEPSLQDAGPFGLQGLLRALAQDALRVEPLELGDLVSVPDNAAAVLLVAPRRPIDARVAEALQQYVNRGGGLLAATEPGDPGNVAGIASRYGIDIRDAVVFDIAHHAGTGSGAHLNVIAEEFADHPVARGMPSGGAVVFSLATHLSTIGLESRGSRRGWLLRSSRDSWASRNSQEVLRRDSPPLAPVEGDSNGPLILAATWERQITSTRPSGSSGNTACSRILILGDSDPLRNAWIDLFANRDFALNAVHWLAGQERQITSRSGASRPMAAPLPASTIMTITTCGMLMGELLLLVGLWLWRQRSA